MLRSEFQMREDVQCKSNKLMTDGSKTDIWKLEITAVFFLLLEKWETIVDVRFQKVDHEQIDVIIVKSQLWDTVCDVWKAL